MKTIQEIIRHPLIHRGEGQIVAFVRRPGTSMDRSFDGKTLVAYRPLEVKTKEEGWRLDYYMEPALAELVL